MAPQVVLVLMLAVQASASPGHPPYFTTEPGDIVLYQTSLVLNCSAQGDPSPTITWYRGDPPALVPDGYVLNGSLVIPTVVEGVDASRGGIPYHCRATSDQFGTIRSRTATVYYAFFDGFLNGGDITNYVNIRSIPADRDTVALYCNISGSNPPPSIIWVDDLNQTVSNNGTKYLYLEGGRYLVIVNIDMTVAQRVFHCRITNVFGFLAMDSPTRYRFNTSASYSGGLIIYKPLQNVTAYDGDTNVQFSLVAAASSGPITVDYAVTYQCPGSLLQGGLNKQSTVVGVLPSPVSKIDSGTVVRCTVFGSAEVHVVQYFATLTVLARANLVVTSSPGDSLDCFVGDNVSFTCEAIGVDLGKRWYRNGEEVSPGPHMEISGFTMTIYGLLEGDSGMYQCSVSNGTSSVWRQWRVVVREPKLVSIPIKDSVLVVNGESGTTLTVQVMSYPPPDYVQWYMNGSLVMSSDLYLISNISVSDVSTVPITYNASLTISSVNLTTQGFYLASFYGKAGVVNTSAIFVTPPVPPSVLGLSVPVCLKAGGSVQLVCEVYGYPIPTVHFFKDNASIFNDVDMNMTANTLTITNAQPDDGGVYSCSAESGDVDTSIGYELLYCYDVTHNVSTSIAANSSKITSPAMISGIVVSLVVAVVVAMVAVVVVVIGIYRRSNSKHCSVDINEHYTDDKNPYNLSHRESSVELLNQQPVVETFVPSGVYETVCLPSKKPCIKSGEVHQQPLQDHSTPVNITNVTYSLPDLSKKKQGQDPSTIVRIEAPKGDHYTVPDKKRATKNEPDRHDNLCKAQDTSFTDTTSNHHTIAPQTGETYVIQSIDLDSRKGEELQD